jgi:hypothetical protein
MYGACIASQNCCEYGTLLSIMTGQMLTRNRQTENQARPLRKKKCVLQMPFLKCTGALS